RVVGELHVRGPADNPTVVDGLRHAGHPLYGGLQGIGIVLPAPGGDVDRFVKRGRPGKVRRVRIDLVRPTDVLDLVIARRVFRAVSEVRPFGAVDGRRDDAQVLPGLVGGLVGRGLGV